MNRICRGKEDGRGEGREKGGRKRVRGREQRREGEMKGGRGRERWREEGSEGGSECCSACRVTLRMYVCSLPSRHHCPPPPPVIFGGELEVGQHDGRADCDADQDEVDHQEDAVESVGLPPPHRGEDVVQLH